MKSASM